MLWRVIIGLVFSRNQSECKEATNERRAWWRKRQAKAMIIILRTMFMVLSSWQSHCTSSTSSRDECRAAPGGRRPLDQADRFNGRKSACRYLINHSQHCHLLCISTQPESWYSFYRSAEGRRLSWPRWLVTYRYSCLSARRLSPITAWPASTSLRPTRYH